MTPLTPSALMTTYRPYSAALLFFRSFQIPFLHGHDMKITSFHQAGESVAEVSSISCRLYTAHTRHEICINMSYVYSYMADYMSYDVCI